VSNTKSARTARLLRVVTTGLFVLVGLLAYAFAVGKSSEVRAILQSIGSFLIGTVVVGYAYQYFLTEEVESRTVAKLDEVLRRRVDAVFVDAARHGFSGFVRDAPRRVFDGLGRGDELLWLDTYSPDLMVFLPDLRDAVRNGAHLRMLVIDPTAETAQMRAHEIVEPGYGPHEFCEGVQAFLDQLIGTVRHLTDGIGQLEVRTYRDLPGVPMYLRRVDGRLMSGVTGFFLTEPSFNSTHLRWESVSGGLLDGFLRYFEHKWELSDPIPDPLDSYAADGRG
jgi:hypothetical protein